MLVNRNSWIKNIAESSGIGKRAQDKAIADRVLDSICDGSACENRATTTLWVEVGELGRVQLAVCEACCERLKAE